jgi:hypothetical protein
MGTQGNDVRFWWLSRQVHALGPRVVAELLAELGARYLIRTPIEALLERYAALDPAALAAVGGDRMPPPPIHLVREDRK